MSRVKNIVNQLLAYAISMGLFFVAVYLGNKQFSSKQSFALIIATFIAGAIVFGILNAFLHELGHVLFGKKNNFEILCFVVWFFKWTKRKSGFHFSWTMIGNEAGYTESVPKSTENLNKRVIAMTRGGLLFSFILMIVSILPYVFFEDLPVLLFAFLSVSLPISAYYFLWNILPIKSEGVLNDGAVVWSLKRDTDTSKVMLSLMSIHCELYNGKTPAEIDEKYYFDVPQLAEDDIFFANLLNARYNYYLDKQDDEKAVETIDRLLTILDYLPKAYAMVVKTDALYNACVIQNDIEKAEDYLYEVEKFVNNVNNATNVRVKMAFVRLNGGEQSELDTFYSKAIKEAKKCQLQGLRDYELKLIEGLYGQQA